jgi:integrase/recombinase XerD
MPTERSLRETFGGQAQFMEYLATERRYSEHTLSAYESDLGQFSEGVAKDPLSASTDDIRKFILGCLEAGCSPKTARRKLSAIKHLFQFAHGEGRIDHDPSRHIRAPKAFDKIIRPITRAEVEDILASLDTKLPLHLRDRALVYVAYGSGLRVSEIVNLKIVDVHFQQSIAKVRQGKGQKDRFVPLNQLEMDAISLYLEKARPRLAREPDNGLLFIGHYGDILTRQRLWQILTRISARIVGRVISPHKYRHAFVTDTINGGAGSRVVQKMVGHVSVKTTMDYMHSDLEHLRAEYLKSHPRGAAYDNARSNRPVSFDQTRGELQPLHPSRISG